MSGLPAWADVEPSPSDQPRHGPSAPYTPKPSGSWLRRLLGLSWAWLFAGCWAQAPADPRALDFAKNFSDHCLNSRANWSLKRDELNRRWRKLAPPQSASFLSGQAGQAWHVPSVENEGNMVLSMGSKKEFCALLARRAERLEAERLFLLLVANSPPPWRVQALDEVWSGQGTERRHSLSYVWLDAQGQARWLFTLTTSEFEQPSIQALASVTSLGP